jgi:hypothetical protein
MKRFVAIFELKPGAGPEVSAMLREGPPFDIDATGLERHFVFLGGDRLVFLFEGEHADREARHLLAESKTFERFMRLAPLIEAGPETPVEAFGWERGGEPTEPGSTPQSPPGDSSG